MPIDLGTNLNWNRTKTFVEQRTPRSDPLWQGRIADRVFFVEDPKFIVVIGTPDPKPWWITAGRIIVELNFQFDSTSALGSKVVVYQNQLLLRRSNLIWLEPYVFPWLDNLSKYRVTLTYQKWLDAVTTEVFEYDY